MPHYTPNSVYLTLCISLFSQVRLFVFDLPDLLRPTSVLNGLLLCIFVYHTVGKREN